MGLGNRTCKTVIWRTITVPPYDEITLTLKARVFSRALPGEHINIAQAYDPARNIPVSNKATAAVRILPDHAFDCGEVLGKVFDDENLDGYQNAGEPGIAGARLMTVDGSLITADSSGRFHVPCAVLPDRNGTNYSLKLDTNSLPTGYRDTQSAASLYQVSDCSLCRCDPAIRHRVHGNGQSYRR